jgi:hypothetical protein
MPTKAELIARHVDAIATVFGRSVVAIITIEPDGVLSIVTPADHHRATLRCLAQVDWQAIGDGDAEQFGTEGI